MGHLRLTSIGYLKATVAHIRVTLGHLRVTIGHPWVTVGHCRVDSIGRGSSHNIEVGPYAHDS